MTITVLEPGMQTTLQAAPRTGLRHAGVPASGPADAVAMALANRLVDKAPYATALEITYGSARFRFDTAMQIGVAGAAADIVIGGSKCGMHETLDVGAGDEVAVGPVRTGARIYLAVSGAIAADALLGSEATYLPAGFGGHQGRALKKGDVLRCGPISRCAPVSTPADLRLALASSYTLRAVDGPDLGAGEAFPWHETFTATSRLSRMGIEIEGALPVTAGALLPSSAVFPGALQVTPQGRGFLLLADGQTTGGYPHLAQVIRADRHLLGQIRPGDRIQFLHTSQRRAEEALRAKQALLQSWMPEFRL